MKQFLTYSLFLVPFSFLFADMPPSVEFTTPAEDDCGAMVLGNGEIGALAWVSADGTLHTVL